jgi:hypothetical protein
MAKNTINYRDYVKETMKAFDENRVLPVSQGKDGLPTPPHPSFFDKLYS